MTRIQYLEACKISTEKDISSGCVPKFEIFKAAVIATNHLDIYIAPFSRRKMSLKPNTNVRWFLLVLLIRNIRSSRVKCHRRKKKTAEKSMNFCMNFFLSFLLCKTL
jgi:hypothetical protein